MLEQVQVKKPKLQKIVAILLMAAILGSIFFGSMNVVLARKPQIENMEENQFVVRQHVSFEYISSQSKVDGTFEVEQETISIAYQGKFLTKGDVREIGFLSNEDTKYYLSKVTPEKLFNVHKSQFCKKEQRVYNQSEMYTNGSVKQIDASGYYLGTESRNELEKLGVHAPKETRSSHVYSTWILNAEQIGGLYCYERDWTLINITAEQLNYTMKTRPAGWTNFIYPEKHCYPEWVHTEYLEPCKLDTNYLDDITLVPNNDSAYATKAEEAAIRAGTEWDPIYYEDEVGLEITSASDPGKKFIWLIAIAIAGALMIWSNLQGQKVGKVYGYQEGFVYGYEQGIDDTSDVTKEVLEEYRDNSNITNEEYHQLVDKYDVAVDDMKNEYQASPTIDWNGLDVGDGTIGGFGGNRKLFGGFNAIFRTIIMIIIIVVVIICLAMLTLYLIKRFRGRR